MRLPTEIKGRKGTSMVKIIIVALIASVVAVFVTSTIGGAMGKYAGRDKQGIMCQDPTGY